MTKVLGIESSCDETAASVYDSEKGILSNVLFSQIELHKIYGGVMPEIASRSHLEKIRPIVATALKTANTTLNEIDVIAVTNKPGLPGSLLVGLSFAKALAWSTKKQLVGINHLEGHVYSACIEREIPFPFICLTASGGHTALYLVESYDKYQIIGHTLDDAAGEAFDKISKLMNFPYPGGPIIEKLAADLNFQDFMHYPRSMPHSLDFSFSGLKTSVLYDLVKRDAYDLKNKKFTKDSDICLKRQVSSSLLVCIADIFKQKLSLAFKIYKDVKAVAFVGGVACNKYINKQLSELSVQNNKLFFSPSPQYCTDNGAMIAFIGYHRALQQNKNITCFSEQQQLLDLTLDID